MREDAPKPQINASKIVIGGGIAGVIFTVGSMLIFLIGIPVLRYIFPAAIVLGCAVALILRFIRHETPGAPWILSSNVETEDSSRPEHKKNPGHIIKGALGAPTILRTARTRI